MGLNKYIVRFGPLVISNLFSYIQKYDTSFIDSLNKPKLYPPGALIGIIWTVLYYNMGVALEKIYFDYPVSKERNKALFLFIVQYILNLAWSPIFFKNKKFKTAFIVIVVLILAVILTLKSFTEIDPSTKNLLIPYLIWLFIAAYINKYLLDNNPKYNL
uniref:TspO/MBR family protein n=1 Tax=viral metagenome TaxID=1070528 RepID=A0A6C0EJ96_9ZZZZ